VQGSEQKSSGSSPIVRFAAVAAIVIGTVLAAFLLFGGSSGHKYKLIFETGGQLVPGNLVSVGGQQVGTVDDIKLTDDARAEVSITVDDPLHEGTTAVVRATSLSGIANRYVSLAPGPNSAPELDDDTVIAEDKTTSPVDIDQLFDTFNNRTRKALAGFIQGQATVYGGNAEQANEAYKYLAPSLQSTERLLAELTRDQQVFSDFLASGSSVLDAVAQRRDDLSSAISNANQALGAIASQNQAFDTSLAELPPTLRQANTTFVNLRAALDDLQPLIDTTGVATKDLAPFLRELRPIVEDSVPVFSDLSQVVLQQGPANDLVDTLRALPGAKNAADRSVPATIKALDDSQLNVAQLRAYSPDLLGFLGRFSQVAANYDGDGHYLRVSPAGVNFFSWNPTTSVLDPIPVAQQFADFDNGFFNRCPGGSTQPIGGSNPFLDDGALDGVCDPAAVPPGP
jgi:phospholipid/cholesterol/gamma-HCH transport system substrate-binding protein